MKLLGSAESRGKNFLIVRLTDGIKFSTSGKCAICQPLVTGSVTINNIEEAAAQLIGSKLIRVYSVNNPKLKGDDRKIQPLDLQVKVNAGRYVSRKDIPGQHHIALLENCKGGR